MGLTARELAKRDDFARQYQLGQRPVMQTIERAVCGCDYGTTAWTTIEEAGRIAALLELKPGLALLEIGAGSGWPAVYLGQVSGCDVTLTDLPLNGLRMAVERAARNGSSGTCVGAVADAARLPFDDGRFDVVDHSDVLCCLGPKRQVLAECRRVIRPGGRMAFSVIYVPPGLSRQDHARALETAPEFADSEMDYPTLITATGWTIIERLDLTAAFVHSCRQTMSMEKQHRAELVALIGAADFEARQTRMSSRLAIFKKGHLRRDLFLVGTA